MSNICAVLMNDFDVHFEVLHQIDKLGELFYLFCIQLRAQEGHSMALENKKNIRE